MDGIARADADLAALGRDGGLLTVDLGAVRANYRLLRDRVGAAECAGVVKADGYRLGAAAIMQALAREGCRNFFVAHLSEAVALRPALPGGARLIVLHGPTPGAEPDFAAHGILPVLNTVQQVAGWSRLCRERGARLAALLQLDSGMTRFGLSEPELDDVLGQGVLGDFDLLYVMSHLACADAPEHPANAAQLAAFGRMRAALPGVKASLAASSGIFLGPAYHFDLVRPGVALYGVAPTPGANPMRPVIRLQGLVVQVRDVACDVAVGYGHVGRTDRRARLATVAVGYADGFHRSLGGAAAGWIGDVRLPIIGRVSMDSLVLDATDAGPVAPGTLVDLIGPHQDVDAVAAMAGTIGYEILTGLGHRYARRLIGVEGSI